VAEIQVIIVGCWKEWQAYKALLEICRLLWEKVAHLHKQGIEGKQIRLCTEDEIGTLSKPYR
jgi:hypothetical protein